MNIFKSCRSAPKRVTVILCCIFTVISLTSCSSKSSNPALGEMPYGVEWGMTYEQVAKKVPNSVEPVLNSSETSYISMPYLDGSLDGFDEIDMTVAISYSFGLNDSLKTVTEFIFLSDEETVSANTIVSDMVTLLSDQYGEYEQPMDSYLGILLAIYTWDTDYGTIKVTLMDESTIIISLNPD